LREYEGMVRRDATADQAHLEALLRLVGRRPDADLVFADAGRRAARYAARSGGRSARTVARVSPAGLGRRVALRSAARLARRVFGGDLRAPEHDTEVRMTDLLSILAVPDGAACTFYGAAYGELLRCLMAFEGAMLHERCRSRGDDACVWRSAAAEVYE